MLDLNIVILINIVNIDVHLTFVTIISTLSKRRESNIDTIIFWLLKAATYLLASSVEIRVKIGLKYTSLPYKMTKLSGPLNGTAKT